MPFSYKCTKCDAVLNPNIRVVLIAEHEGAKGIVLMSAQLGDYSIICDKGFCNNVAKGSKVEFRCPVCCQSLTSETHENFAELAVVNAEKPDQKPYLLRFSRVSEEHATFLYDGEKVEAWGKEAGLFSKELQIEGDWGW